MADSPRRPDPDAGTDRGSLPSTPRWVKVSVIIVGVLILLAVILKLTGLGGEHGPDRHTGAGDTPSTSVTQAQASSADDPDDHAPLRGSY
ncbi:hypothetical protein [Nocardiopsis tropica]|uniref:Uncharacterized protein n=1 Tax=Nocardiopsis tropica TaxID=109330 RepID=A0ABU7KK35_9ACTN|nr:hypothetical protein [Nocardiopsis umidischolae]MEE2049658.1 hypothetical protein [Nocardiopsis umidischolae]